MTGLARGFAVVVLTGLLAAAVRAVPFDHTEHATLFVRCETCHAGAAATDRPLWPAPAECSTCHDGKIEKAVTWTPRTGPLPSNLRFTHDVHRSAFAKAQPRDSALSCAACHSTEGAKWMTVQRDVIGNCLACHKAGPDHFEAQPGQCATCHVPFWEMPAGVTPRHRWRRGRRRHRMRLPISSRLTASWPVPSSWTARTPPCPRHARLVMRGSTASPVT